MSPTSSAYFQPILSYGKTATALTSGAITSGVVEILVDNTADTFAIDDLLFISLVDDSTVQYLGKIVDVSPDKSFVTVTLPTYSSYAAGSKLWTPTTTYVLDIGPGFRGGWRGRTGVVSRISRGGQLFVTRTADNVDVLTWNFDDVHWLRSFDFKGVLAWVRGNRRGGLDEFSIGYWDHFVEEGRPRVVQAKMVFQFTGDDEAPGLTTELLDGDDATAHESKAQSLFRFVVEADDTYVEA